MKYLLAVCLSCLLNLCSQAQSDSNYKALLKEFLKTSRAPQSSQNNIDMIIEPIKKRTGMSLSPANGNYLKKSFKNFSKKNIQL
jgi:hypothetical protein